MAVLAHQGGWDEILLILGPMAIVVLLLALAKRRVERNLATGEAGVAVPPDDAAHPAPTQPRNPDSEP